jgi:hypothetical protein
LLVHLNYGGPMLLAFAACESHISFSIKFSVITYVPQVGKNCLLCHTIGT